MKNALPHLFFGQSEKRFLAFVAGVLGCLVLSWNLLLTVQEANQLLAKACVHAEAEALRIELAAFDVVSDIRNWSGLSTLSVSPNTSEDRLTLIKDVNENLKTSPFLNRLFAERGFGEGTHHKGLLMTLDREPGVLTTLELRLLSIFLNHAASTVGSLFHKQPLLHAVLCVSRHMSVICPWTQFPPDRQLDFIQGLYKIRYTDLLSTYRLFGGWEPAFKPASRSDPWTLRYLHAWPSPEKPDFFFVIVLGKGFFQDLAKKIQIPFGKTDLQDQTQHSLLEEQRLFEDSSASDQGREPRFAAVDWQLSYQAKGWWGGRWTYAIPLKGAPWTFFWTVDGVELAQLAMGETWKGWVLSMVLAVVLILMNGRLLNLMCVRPARHVMTQLTAGQMNLKTAFVYSSPFWQRFATTLSEVLEKKQNALQRLEATQSAQARDLQSTILMLQESQRQVVTQEKMANLGTLATGIAHELKNPLNLVLNFSLLLRDAAQGVGELSADIKTYSEKVLLYAERSNETLNRILDQTKHHSESPWETLEIERMVRDYAALLFKGFVGDHPEFPLVMTVRSDALPTDVYGQSFDLGRVFLNLFVNAFDATFERFVADKDVNGAYVPQVWIVIERNDTHLCVHVEDNGPGLPDEMACKIFDPFFTTKMPGQGTGLGLSLGLNTAHRHGGNLAFSRPDTTGARFTLTLPCVQSSESTGPLPYTLKE